MFRNIASSIKSTYSTNDDVAREFYNPILANSVSYQRVSGFFSCQALALYATGLDRLADSGGHVRFIISTEISRDDFLQIKTGYQLRDSLGVTLDDLTDDESKKIGNLAYLISVGKADVRFGVSASGLFHSKWGYFEDEVGDTIYFIGSNNETGNGIAKNYEDFDVDSSWDVSPNVRKRIATKKAQFEQLWNNQVENVTVVEADSVLYDMIKDFNKGRIQSLPGRDLNALFLEFDGRQIRFTDHTESQVFNKPSLARKVSYYVTQSDPTLLRADLNYAEVDELIKAVKTYCESRHIHFYVGDLLEEFLNNQRYSITEYKKAGLTIKSNAPYWQDRYEAFKARVSGLVFRPLKEEQMRAAFFFVTQKRAANFSVPGSGKTTTMLGAFAYLNQGERPAVKRILVVSPLNAFTSWTDEFGKEFNGLKRLRSVSSRDGAGSIRARWSEANLVLVNYESLTSIDVLKALQEGLAQDGQQTMLIFDEVHRIKSLTGKRASAARTLTSNVEYRYVMTGTPIPNGYVDIWQFLHLLYNDEYENFFGFTQQQLKSPDDSTVKEINDDLGPFFWRTNKDKLGVPKAEDDQLIEVRASAEQLRLADTLYETESNPLSIMIRLMQLSTNPALLNKSLSLDDVIDAGFGDDESDDDSARASVQKQIKAIDLQKVSDIDLASTTSPKFERGIDLVVNTYHQYGKVVVWALFVDTIDRISASLNARGLRTAIVYGATPLDERDSIISTFKQDNDAIQVLITNPNTLGESISLHKQVHNAVYFEYNYNLTYMLQSRDRIHRLGLKEGEKTRYWYLMTTSEREYHNFIDKKIYMRIKDKEKLMLETIDKGILEPSYSDKELDEMAEIINSESRV